MKTKKLSKPILSKKQKHHLAKGNQLNIDKQLINQLFADETQYRLIVFEGTMDMQSKHSISKQINMTQGGIGLHTIKTCENKKQAKNLYQTLFQEAIDKAKQHHKNFIAYQRPDLSSAEQNLLIDFDITAMVIAQFEKGNVLQGFITANCTNNKIILSESAIKSTTPHIQPKQEHTVNK